ncbi:VAN3-binding protein [Arachis hypogaea]|nr:VAN3-binding protein [Arachis hypogaea]
MNSSSTCINGNTTPPCSSSSSGPKTVGKWLKERREKKKEENRTHNAQLYASISAAAAVAAVTATLSASNREDEKMGKIDMAVASAAKLVAAQCVEAAESRRVLRVNNFCVL